MCSCAGGVNVRSKIPVARESANGAILNITIKGLVSGHSGVEIDKGRANANSLMGRLLCELAAKEDYRLATLDGGSRDTAIAASATAQIVVEDTKAAAVCDIIKALGVQYASEYATAEPNMAVDATCMKTGAISALTAGSTEKVYSVLVALPDSVQAMSVDMPGLVQTSTNFGVMKLEENENSTKVRLLKVKEMVLENAHKYST